LVAAVFFFFNQLLWCTGSSQVHYQIMILDLEQGNEQERHDSRI